jgi:DNA invertase Pin-like site-specific DNA recombinase
MKASLRNFFSVALAEFERELISERTVAGFASARASGRSGGRPFKMTPAKLRMTMAGKPTRTWQEIVCSGSLNYEQQPVY